MSRVVQMLVVTHKELRDALRDRRTIYSVLFGSVVGPVLVGVMFNALADRQREVETITIPVVGRRHAPALITWLEQQWGVTVIDGPADPDEAIRRRDYDVVVVVPADYEATFRVSRPVHIQLVVDGSRSGSRPTLARVRALLQQYAGEIAAARLIGRGVSPAIVIPLQIQEREVSSAQQRAAVLLNFVPLFIVLAAFTGGMPIASDSTAGERERGSLEPLLVNPAPRLVIVSGKWLAAAASAAVSVALTATFCVILLRAIPLQELGIRFRFGALDAVRLLAAVLPLCLFSTAIQTCLSTFARSYKEAQTYMGYLIMVPTLPGVLSSVYPIASHPWMYPVPVLGQHLLASDILGGKAPDASVFIAAALATMAASLVLLQLATRLLQRERIIFGR